MDLVNRLNSAGNRRAALFLTAEDRAEEWSLKGKEEGERKPRTSSREIGRETCKK